MDGAMTFFTTIAEKAQYVAENLDYEEFSTTVRNDPILYFTLFFIASKWFVPQLSEQARKKYLNPALKVYNALMVVYSFATFLVMAKALSQITLMTEDCDAAFRNPLFEQATRFFVYSKYVEYFDSWSLMMAGKRVSFLQSFHHVGAPWGVWLPYVMKSEYVYLFVLLNSFVHTIMYAYYLAALYKIRFPLKFLITTMQITQFLTGFYMVWFYKDLDCISSSPNKLLGWVYNYIYVGIVLVLFLNFFLWSYIAPKPKKGDKAKSL